VIRAALVAAVVLGGCTPLPPTAVAYVPTRANAVCAITEVVDGDTLRLSCTEGRGGTVRLVGTDTATIIREVSQLLADADVYQAMSYAHNPYGDGLASQRILSVLKQHRVTA